MTWERSSSELTAALRNFHLTRAKQASGENLVLTSNHEVQVDGGVSASHDSPEQVLQHGIVLVLTTAIVGVQADTGLTQTVVAEKVIQQADNCVCTLACVTCLINDKVHLSWYSLTANSKNGSLPRSEEINWARLERIARVVHLLSKIKGIIPELTGGRL